MRLAFLALIFLAACGGGASSSFDPVTHVVLTDSIGADAHAWWNDSGTGIDIYKWTDTPRASLLAHELWHLLTRNGDHPNPWGCISYQSVYDYGDDPPSFPCSMELDQVLEQGRHLTVTFPEDPEPLLEAAAFWNDALGYTAVAVQ